MDIAKNTEFKVKLTPKHDKSVNGPNLNANPVERRPNCWISSNAQLWNQHGNGYIQVRQSHVHAEKAQWKLYLLVDLRKINSLIAEGYTNNNHPVSSLSDTAQHLAGRSLFCKLNCSQAYHCLEMADQRSAEMHAFNFVSRFFAYKRLAQGLIRSVSAF